MQKFRALSLFLVVTLSCFGVHADDTLMQRKDVRHFVRYMVKKHKFNQAELTETLKNAQFQPQIIASMDKPYEKKTWDVYRELFLTQERIQAGVNFWRANQQVLEKAQDKFNVPASIIVAIIGVETLYGKHQGHYRVLDALTTLAFYYPKRSPFFTKELEEYLLLCREQGISPTGYLGSYAGAIGKPQFMPSSYRFYAVDFAGKGKRDLINDDNDVIASVANYFHKHGWKMNEVVVEPAKLVGSHYKKIQMNSKRPNYDVEHLIAAGVHPFEGNKPQPNKAGLIELATLKGPEYWVAYPNFYVITRYNTSPQYAMVVYLLSQQLNKEYTH